MRAREAPGCAAAPVFGSEHAWARGRSSAGERFCITKAMRGAVYA